MAKVNISLTDTVQTWVNGTNTISNNLGDLASLITTEDSDIVGAINSLNNQVDSDLTALQSQVDSNLALLQNQIDSNDANFITRARTAVSASNAIQYNSSTGVITHEDTSSQATVTNTGNAFIKSVSVDTYGHVTNLASGTVTLTGLGVNASAAELNHSVGVTSAIQTQLDSKANNVNASIATSISLTGAASTWQFGLSGNNLIISYGGTTMARLDTSGNLVVKGDVTAFGVI